MTDNYSKINVEGLTNNQKEIAMINLSIQNNDILNSIETIDPSKIVELTRLGLFGNDVIDEVKSEHSDFNELLQKEPEKIFGFAKEVENTHKSNEQILGGLR